ncbi:MAG: DHHA1 domain-containing protein [Halobacteriaceae archaeon]
MSFPVPPLKERANICAKRLVDADSVLLVSHIDADGLTSAGIGASLLKRSGINYTVQFAKQLDEDRIRRIFDTNASCVLFTDFGSGQLETIITYAEESSTTPIIADHHQPADVEYKYHLNPLLEGIDGSKELSGAGATYLLARACSGDNRDLTPLAIVGAVGDMQMMDGELVGANKQILKEGIERSVVGVSKDLAIYGKQTRPIHKLLEYGSDVYIPGISYNHKGVVDFLHQLDVTIQTNGRWPTWTELSKEQRQAIVSQLIQIALKRGVSTEKIDRLIGQTYILSNEPEGTTLRDASEFSTLLNATARYGRGDVGLAVCLGNRNEALDQAKTLLNTHRRNLSEGLRWVKQNGITKKDNLQWFHAHDNIRETIVGIIAGMAYSAENVDRSIPIIGFATKNDTEIKVSSRATSSLIQQGLDLSVIMETAAEQVGGSGGGHNIAAGATIPDGQEQSFLTIANQLIDNQLSG